MKNLSLIAAIGKNNELGLDNHLLWHIPEDLKFYKSMTWGKNVIVGKNTFLSMPYKAFENRNVFVLSHSNLDDNYDVNCFDSIETLLSYVEENIDKEFMVIGGAAIYEAFLPYVDTMYLTHVDEDFNADTFFPDFDINGWDSEILGEYKYNDLYYLRGKYTRKRAK